MPYDYLSFYALLTAVIIFALVVSAVVFVWSSFAMMHLFKKSGHSQPWSAWVPFYRDFVFLEVGGQSGWFLFLPIAASLVASLTSNEYGIRWLVTIGVSVLISAVAGVIWVAALVNINVACGKQPVGFTIFAVLLPPAWLSVVAWGGAIYDPNRARGPLIPLQEPTFLETTRRQTSQFLA